MDNTLTYISILATLIAIIVAINVAYNFFSIHEFRKKLETIQENLNNDLYKLKDDINEKIVSTTEELTKIQSEIEKFKKMNEAFVQLMYEMNNANAKFRFNDGCYFEAILVELKNIYHITIHKNSFSQKKYKEIIDVKYWFIANDILKYEDDKYVRNDNADEKNELINIRDNIIRVCNEIESHQNSINVKDKLTPIFFVVRNLLDDLYYNHPIETNSQYWNKVRELAK